MKIEKVKITELNSPEWNPRDMPPEEMEKLEKSIKEFGYVELIVVNEFNMNIVGENQRVVALKKLGYTTVDAVMIYEPDLNREKSLNITLNNVHGGWDLDLLEEIITDMELDGFDVSLTSLDDVQLAELEIGGGGNLRYTCGEVNPNNTLNEFLKGFDVKDSKKQIINRGLLNLI